MATKTDPRSSVFQLMARQRPDAIHELGTDPTEWAKRARLDWEIKVSDVGFTTDGKKVTIFPGKQAFYRSDTEDALAIVGKRFHPVQPKDILDFYGEVSKRYGFKLAIAGEVNMGRKIWGMAETPHEFELVAGDKVRGGLFVVTACDGSLSTQGMFTSVRMFCLNQLPVMQSLAKRGQGLQVFKVTHGAKFNTARIERDLEVMEAGWGAFKHTAEALAHKKVTETQAINFLAKFFHNGEHQVFTVADVEAMKDNTTMRRIVNVYRGGEGQQGIVGTAWGVVNAVTRYLDHETRAKDGGTVVRKAWIEGSRLKSDVLAAAVTEFTPGLIKKAA